MALPCLSSTGDEDIRRSAEALFEKLAYLDGDGVWLLLLQTLDIAAAATPTTPATQGQIQYGDGGGGSGAGGGGGGGGDGGGGSGHNGDGGGVETFLPDPPLPSCAAIPTLVRGRPSFLAESRSIFSGGRVAAECAPSAAILLGRLSADGRIAEHM